MLVSEGGRESTDGGGGDVTGESAGGPGSPERLRLVLERESTAFTRESGAKTPGDGELGTGLDLLGRLRLPLPEVDATRLR